MTGFISSPFLLKLLTASLEWSSSSFSLSWTFVLRGHCAKRWNGPAGPGSCPSPWMGACLAFTSLGRRSEERGRLNYQATCSLEDARVSTYPASSGTACLICRARAPRSLPHPSPIPGRCSHGSACADSAGAGGNCACRRPRFPARVSKSPVREPWFPGRFHAVAAGRLESEKWQEDGRLRQRWRRSPALCEGQVYPEPGKKALPSFQGRSTVAGLMSSNH